MMLLSLYHGFRELPTRLEMCQYYVNISDRLFSRSAFVIYFAPCIMLASLSSPIHFNTNSIAYQMFPLTWNSHMCLSGTLLLDHYQPISSLATPSASPSLHIAIGIGAHISLLRIAHIFLPQSRNKLFFSRLTMCPLNQLVELEIKSLTANWLASIWISLSHLSLVIVGRHLVKVSATFMSTFFW